MLVDYVPEWDNLQFRLGQNMRHRPTGKCRYGMDSRAGHTLLRQDKVYATVVLDPFRRIVC